MADSTKAQSILVIGGAEGAGMATVRALRRRGHKVAATACDAEGALAIRLAGALPVFPELSRASEILSILRLTEAEALVHAGPQYFGGSPQSGDEYAAGPQLVEITAAVTEAAREHGVKRLISLSFGYLYETGHGAAKEGDHDVHEGDYAPMLAAENCLRESGLPGYIIRSGYIYGGACTDTAALADAIKGARRLPAGDRPASWLHEDDLASAIVALLEAEEAPGGMSIINAASASAASPNEFCAALSQALGLNQPRFRSEGFLSMLREKSLREQLLGREILIDSGRLRDGFSWRPAHESLESGLEATALVWRMQDAVEAEDFYNVYPDEAASAIESIAYDVALPEPVAATEAEAAPEAPSAPAPEPVQAAAPPPSDGPTPWNEDEAKREERRRRALERKAKRAARSAGG